MSSPQSGFFLSLAPATSSSYPRAPASRAPLSSSNNTPPIEQPQEQQQQQPSSRRSSSSSSTGYKVLKLGPVHWGEHLDDHKLDYHETVVLP